MSTKTTLSVEKSAWAAAPGLPDIIDFSAAARRPARSDHAPPHDRTGRRACGGDGAHAIFAPRLGTVDPTALSPTARTRPPSGDYWFGSDMLGRGIYSRVLYGARISLMVGFSVALLASVIGLAIGLVAGFVRWLDGVLMRVMDGLMSVPPILLAIAMLALMRGSVGNVIMAITIAEVPRVSRLVRSMVLSLRDQPFIDGAIASGSRTPSIIIRHVLPNTPAPLTVQATYIRFV